MSQRVVTEIVAASELHEYLERHGLRVVRGGWKWGERRPYLIVAPTSDGPARTGDAGDDGHEPERTATNAKDGGG